MEPGDGRSMIREHVARREPDERPEDELDGGWALAVLFRECRELEDAAFRKRCEIQRVEQALRRQRARRPDPAPETGLQAELRDWIGSR